MFLYEFGHIDYDWHLIPTVEEFCMNPDLHHVEDLLLDCLRFAKVSTSWDGTFVFEPRILFFPHVDNSFGWSYGFVWKISNNGTTYVVSPVEMPWLSEHGSSYSFHSTDFRHSDLCPYTETQEQKNMNLQMNMRDIINRYPLIEFLKARIKLKKKGAFYQGECLFCSEESFTIHDEKSYYCFSCEVAGDIITLIAKIKHLTPRRAIDYIRQFSDAATLISAMKNTKE